MIRPVVPGALHAPGNTLRPGERNAVDPQPFSSPSPLLANAAALLNNYLADPSIAKLIAFFDAKGVAAIKDEDRRESFYPDWLAYQATHRLYASVLESKDDSEVGIEFDLSFIFGGGTAGSDVVDDLGAQCFQVCSQAHIAHLNAAQMAVGAGDQADLDRQQANRRRTARG